MTLRKHKDHIARKSKSHHNNELGGDMRFFRTLRSKLTLYVALAAVVPLLLSAVVSSLLAYNSHKKYTRNFQNEITVRVISEINLVTDNLTNILVSMQKEIVLHDMTDAVLKDYLELSRKQEIGGQKDVIDELSFLDRHGMEKVRVSRISVITEADLKDRSVAAEFREPVKRVKPYIGAVIKGEEEPYVYFSVPVFEVGSGETIGVLSAKVRVSRMWDFAVKGVVKEGAICVVSNDGIVLAHTDPSAVIRHLKINYGSVGDVGQGPDGKRVIRTVREFRFGDHINYVVVDIPFSIAMKLFHSILATSTALLVLFLAAGVALGAAAVRNMVRPVEELASTAREISSGNFALRAQKRNNDEIGELADSFNSMTDRLISKINLLNEKEKLNRRNYSYQLIINQLLQIAMQNVSVAEFFKQVFEKVSRAGDLGIDNSGAIFLANERTRELVLSAQNDLSETSLLKCTIVPYGECICGKAAMTGEAVFASSVDERHSRRCENMMPHGHYCIPFFSSRNSLLGVITFVLKDRSEREPQIQSFLESVAKVTALVFERRTVEEDRLKLESKLRQSHKMEALGTLAGGIAHDFNNILSPIIGFTQLVMADLHKDSPLYERLNHVSNAGLKARDLVSQILAFSRQIELKSIPLYPDIICSEALIFLRASIPSSIEILHDIDPNCGMIKIDPTHLHQVLLNLCTNSYHAMEETGGTIEVSLKQVVLMNKDFDGEISRQPGRYVELSVRDTGAGIPPEIMGNIFDPYFTTKESGKGTGMGLPIVHGIVKSYQGIVRLDSKIGKGTTFRIYFPVVDGAETEEPPQADDDTPGGTERILFVDDERTVAEFGRSMLLKLGYNVTVRNSGTEALEIFRSCPDQFDLVITDMTMFGMSGDVLAREILKIRPAMPIILCTGYSTKISREKAASLGITAFLYKPLLVKDLAEMIRAILDGKQ